MLDASTVMFPVHATVLPWVITGHTPLTPMHALAHTPTVVAPKVVSQVNGHASGCDALCQSKCQRAWRALGFGSVNACVARWAKLNAEGTAATCETAIKANGMRPIRGC